MDFPLSVIVYTIRKYPVKSCFLGLCLIILAGFEIWQNFSPPPAQAWNTINLKKIQVIDPNNFYFAIFGDNRNSKFVFENLLKLIDHDPDITFAISLGDMVQSGNKEKYRFFLQQVEDNLAIPLLTGIGNHELKGRGRSLYGDIFGPSYYSFNIGNNYFIVLDDVNENGLDLAQSQWLETELARSQSFDSRMLFMHRPLYDPRGGSLQNGLPEKLAANLMKVFLKYHVSHVFCSHIHGYFEGKWKSIPYTITGGAGGAFVGNDPAHYFFHFLKVQIKKGSVSVQVKHVVAPPYEQMGRYRYTISLYWSAFLRFYGIETVGLILAGGLGWIIYRSESRMPIKS